MRLGRVRKATREDFKLLATMEAAEAEQHHIQETLERCQAEAEAEVNGTSTKRSPRETFLESKYKKKGSKARKEALFPDLERRSARHGRQSRSL